MTMIKTASVSPMPMREFSAAGGDFVGATKVYEDFSAIISTIPSSSGHLQT